MTISALFDLFVEGITLPIKYFISPDKRINILYLFSSLILAFYIYLKSKPGKGFINYVFSKKIWLGKSAQIDYCFLFINGLFKVILLAPFVVISIFFQENISVNLTHLFGVPTFEISRFTIVVTYTVVLWLADDFASFIVHYLLHKIPFLWRFHKIHHAATVLNPITQYRIHPGELVLNNIKFLTVFGIVTGIFYYLGNGKIGIIGFLGVNIFKFIFLAFGSNLRHSHVKLTFPKWLEHLVISPYQHQIHHSDNPFHYDSNIGSHLAIWDWLFGTLTLSEKVTKITFGLGKEENKRYHKLTDNLFSPFRIKK